MHYKTQSGIPPRAGSMLNGCHDGQVREFRDTLCDVAHTSRATLDGARGILDIYWWICQLQKVKFGLILVLTRWLQYCVFEKKSHNYDWLQEQNNCSTFVLNNYSNDNNCCCCHNHHHYYYYNDYYYPFRCSALTDIINITDTVITTTTLSSRSSSRRLQHMTVLLRTNVIFNDAFNTFYLRLYGVGHVVDDHSVSERGNPFLYGLLNPISSKGYFICTTPLTG